jgi:hypothetical protein
VVELEPAIDEMARRCRGMNHDVLNHPKVRRIYNDGREYVFTTDEKYDLVISEPSNPYRAGVAALYTQEFYRQVHDRLNDDGLFLQWVQAYEVNQLTVNTVLATARTVFDHVEVWQTIPGDLQLVCAKHPIQYSAAALRERLAGAVMQDALRLAWRVDDLEGFLAHFMANSQFVDEIGRIEYFPHNTDDRTVLEYGFAKTVGLDTGFSVGLMRQAAVKAGQHRPPLSDESVDWDRVETRRVAFNWMFSGDMAPDQQSAPYLRSLAESLTHFRRNKFREALAAWPAERQPSFGNLEQLVLARCHAELGQAECLELLSELESRYPIESAAIRATYHWRNKDTRQAAAALEQFYEGLARDPWVIGPMVFPTLQLTVEVAKKDPDAAARICKLLTKPLAGYRFEPQRLVVRLLVAQHAGTEYVVDTLAMLEPNVPWNEEIIKLRAEAYTAVKHPLAARAERDWQTLQQHHD